ncbi:MAG: hypothetical protein KZQ81_11360 [Candidatus Thiodiazotropha sp. (ex Rostrolucina anterorostrata)]|nr:hypothetical protein [Candidatus Thiodiazotropha sp. (ex Rostrolucina anterorostrata)]
MKWSSLLSPFFLFIVACGGGNATPEPDSTNNAVSRGVFIDSPVSGLDYSCGNISGVTAEDGSFDCANGNLITFSLGGVVLGSAPFSPVISPLDLVTDAGTRTLAVQYIAQFLQMLDSDGDLANGISISNAVRTLSVNWPAIDFSSAQDLSDFISDVASVDNVPHELPSLVQASEHLEQSLGFSSEWYPGCSRVVPGSVFCDLADFPTCDTGGIVISDLQSGMSYSEVVSIVGCHGVLSSVATSPHAVAVYTWGDVVYRDLVISFIMDNGVSSAHGISKG